VIDGSTDGRKPLAKVGSERPVLAVVDSVTLDAPPDPYLTLRALSKYTGCSVRWLRDRLVDAEHPLPCYRLPGGKILIRRSMFDSWVNAYRAEGSTFAADVDRIVARAGL
jgi:helix-turn-helix protein